MEITIRDRMAKRVEDLLGENDALVFQCVTCSEYFLPREFHILKRTWRGPDGNAFTEAYELCPACYPSLMTVKKEDNPHSSAYLVLTKEEFLEKRQAERIGIVLTKNYKAQNLD